MFFMSDFSGHFDIWNNLEKKFFFHFSKIHRGDPYDYDQNRKGPPMNFGKMKKKCKIFFLQFDSRYQNVPIRQNKCWFQNFQISKG